MILAKQNDAMVMTETHDYFSGTIMRGIMAGQYIKACQLGKKAHEDTTFQQLFFNQLRFLPAYPVVDGQRSCFLPLSLQKNKAGTDCIDSIIDTRPDDEVYKSCKGMGIVKSGVLTKASVKKNITLHMSRSQDAERLSGKSEDGNIYNYEAIDAGQAFAGTIQGSEEALQQLMDALPVRDGSFVTSVGRSRNTQYGLCRLDFDSMEDIPPVDNVSGSCVYMRLDTPVLAENSLINTATAFLQPLTDCLKKQFPKENFTIDEENIYAAQEVIDNFVGIWAMRRPRQNALQAGSVFALRKQGGDWTTEELTVLQNLCYEGIGARTEEGFGQLRLWQHGKITLPADKKDNHKQTITEIHSSEVRRLVIDILLQRVLEQVRLKALEDAKELKGLKGTSHMFSRLEAWLGTKDNVDGIQQRFSRKMDDDIQSGKKIYKHLQNIRIKGNTLYDILTGNKEMPYNSIPWNEKLPENGVELSKVVNFELSNQTIKNELFYEYWKWFFRHARKQAVQAKGDE
ncbi:MAG: hypothetical protein LKF48_10485 [Prevotella sp.]|nr:hypothetical protein [Prevotella sp.]MCH4183569.1 hypothetical protein [Prevotella sp.]